MSTFVTWLEAGRELALYSCAPLKRNWCVLQAKGSPDKILETLSASPPITSLFPTLEPLCSFLSQTPEVLG